VDGALNEVDWYIVEVWVGDQLKLGQVQLLDVQVQLLSVRIRPLFNQTINQSISQYYLIVESNRQKNLTIISGYDNRAAVARQTYDKVKMSKFI